MMGDNNTGLFDNAAKKAAESVGNRVGNAAVDKVKKAFGEVQVLSGSAFTRYLENAVKHYNMIKTIATGTQPRPICGENTLYVHIGVKYCGKEYSTQNIEKILQIGNHLFVEGTGGAGKSMLMRYLFLDTAYAFLNRGGTLVPVLLELRRLNTQASKGISAESLLKSVYSCMQEFDAQLDIEQVESSLRKGKLLLLFDGFDEVPESLTDKTADAIQTLCSGFPENPCVVTSRPNAYTVPLQTFSTLESMPLRKDQAIGLARIIWDEDEKTREFCHQLDNTLFEQHKDFAQNPLLLTMMFLTFMYNGSIPEHLSEFYRKAYEALYSAHDNRNKGIFKREFKCKTLDEQSFTRLFSYFCFQSYFKTDYEFTEKKLLGYLERGIQKLGLTGVKARDYLKDLQNIVCMIVADGNLYKFSHRSFQAYFAACYTCDLTDEEQKRFFSGLLAREPWSRRRDYFELLYLLASDRFATNALEDGLRTLQNESDAKPDPNLYFLTCQFSGMSIDQMKKTMVYYPASCERNNAVRLFLHFIMMDDKRTESDYNRTREPILSYLNKANLHSLDFYQIDSVPNLIPEERRDLRLGLMEHLQIEQKRLAIRRWLSEQDEKRRKLDASPDLSALLDAL